MSAFTSFHSQLDWITAQQDSMLQSLIDWSNINSCSDNLGGLAQMLAALKAAYAPLGAIAEEVSIPPSFAIGPTGESTNVPRGKALRLYKRPEAKIKVLLAGHMDTVYPATHPFQQARQTQANILQGPGVADMKGGLVIMLKALEALERHPACASLGWEVLITSDEEVGSIGSEPLLLEAAKRNTFGLIFEPSFADGTLVSSRKGSANFTVTSAGKAAHSGRDFAKGQNAIVPLAAFIIAANRLSDLEKGVTVNIGRVSGGGPVNVVPDFAACGINVRAENAADFEHMPALLQTLVDEANRQGAALKLYAHHQHPPKAFDEKNRRLFDMIDQCAKEEGYALTCRPSGGACDGNFLSWSGLPVIDTLGAIGGHIHSADEYIAIDSLAARARLTALLLFNVAQGLIPTTPFKGQL